MSGTRRGMLDLLERVWGERPDPELLAWWFDRSPAGPGLLTEERDGDRVVALASMSFLRCVVAGREQLVAIPLQVATDADQRGKGIFSRLELANEAEAVRRGCEIAVTFPNDASRPIFLERLGWRALWRGRIWARPPLPALRGGVLRLRELSAADLSEGQSPGQVDGGQLWGGHGSDGRVPGTVPGTSGQIVDGEFLRWRYLGSPRRYRLVGAYAPDELRGVVAIRPERGRVAIVCHALGEVGQILRSLGSARPVLALVPPALRRSFLAAGFLPTPKSILVLGKVLAPPGTLDGRWSFQLGDFDVF